MTMQDPTIPDPAEQSFPHHPAPAETSEPDAELIALCARYVADSRLKELTWLKWQTGDETERRALAIHFPPWVPRQEIDPLYRAAHRISLLPARTGDGLRAKANVLRRWLQHTYGHATPDQSPQFCNDAEMATAWSLVEDLLGERR